MQKVSYFKTTYQEIGMGTLKRMTAVDLNNAIMRGCELFKNITFVEDINLPDDIFNDLTFALCIFHNDLNCAGINFKGSLNLIKVTLRGDFCCENATFQGDLSCKTVIFGGDFCCENATFKDSFFLKDCTYSGYFECRSAIFANEFYLVGDTFFKDYFGCKKAFFQGVVECNDPSIVQVILLAKQKIYVPLSTARQMVGQTGTP